MILERNPLYHGRFEGNVQQVEGYFFTEWSAALEMYETDRLDTLYLPPSELDRARLQGAGEYVSVPLLTTFFVGFDTNRPPFDDVRVRRAFALAVDRETLADVVMRGSVFPATGGFVPSGMPGHAAGIALPYDPDQARQLLAEVGYPDGRGFPVVNSYSLGSGGLPEPWDEYLQAQWRENLGVETAWETIAEAEFVNQADETPPHMLRIGWLGDYPDPSVFLGVAVDETRRWIRWRNPAYDELVAQARRVTDQGERMELYRQADKILVEEAAIVPLTYEQWHLLVKPWVKKYPVSALVLRFWKDVVIEPH
jgi:oligopeptide transport system substrate-binding protein